MQLVKNALYVITTMIAVMLLINLYGLINSGCPDDKVIVRGLWGWECVSR